MAVGRRINYFESSENQHIKIMFSWETILMGEEDQKRYIKITKIEILFADAW
jgi:hypothetical protein